MQGATLRALALHASAYALCMCVSVPLAAADDQAFAMYADDGRSLHARGAFVWLGERSADSAFVLQRPGGIDDPSQGVSDGDEIWIRSQDGRYLTHWGLRPLFTRYEQRAVRWRIARAAGPGTLGIGEAFALRTAAGELELSTLRGRLAITFARAGSAPWSLGCHFEPGPFTAQWTDAARFEVATGPRASQVARAVSWLQANTTTVRMPAGDLPLIVWDDPTLDPPTVGYLITDTLWAAKALQPYDPDLSDSMQHALIAAGWYGNGLNETLFHGVDAIAHRAASSDWAHGTLLDRCSAVGAPSKAVALHVPEMTPDPAWTAGNSAQFVDSAIYTALDEFWHGEVGQARARLRELLVDARAAAGSDSMFWDVERAVMVDQASRCDYDSNVGTCSPQCPSCGQCQGVFCNQYNTAFKLGLVLYAGRVTGVASEPTFSRTFEQIAYRLWESQLADGGLAHLTIYGPDTTALLKSGATGEATAIAVLAESIVAPESMRR